MAERVGFEPTVRLPGRLLSRQLHSTALPSLHDSIAILVYFAIEWYCSEKSYRFPFFFQGINYLSEFSQVFLICLLASQQRNVLNSQYYSLYTFYEKPNPQSSTCRPQAGLQSSNLSIYFINKKHATTNYSYLNTHHSFFANHDSSSDTLCLDYSCGTCSYFYAWHHYFPSVSTRTKFYRFL